MGIIPIKSPREVIRAFTRIVYEVVRQKGSHIRLKHPTNAYRRPVTIPNHDVVKPGLLAQAIKDARLTIEEYIELLKE